jgi:hypothetical protein
MQGVSVPSYIFTCPSETISHLLRHKITNKLFNNLSEHYGICTFLDGTHIHRFKLINAANAKNDNFPTKPALYIYKMSYEKHIVIQKL